MHQINQRPKARTRVYSLTYYCVDNDCENIHLTTDTRRICSHENQFDTVTFNQIPLSMHTNPARVMAFLSFFFLEFMSFFQFIAFFNFLPFCVFTLFWFVFSPKKTQKNGIKIRPHWWRDLIESVTVIDRR